MRITTLLLLALCLRACKENAQETEIALYPGFHLEDGLCVAKYLNPSNSEGQPEWNIRLYYCPDSIPEGIVSLTEENILKYRQGGACFYKNCTIEPEESFTMYIKTPRNFIDSNEYRVLASKGNYLKMIYRYIKNDSISSYKEHDNEEHIKYWQELFSIAQPLKIKNEFCSTKDFLSGPFCDYGIKQKRIACHNEKIMPKCLSKLESLSKDHRIFMHSGAFPVEDCDLGNWRYIKINSLGKEHYEKLKTLLRAN